MHSNTVTLSSLLRVLCIVSLATIGCEKASFLVPEDTADVRISESESYRLIAGVDSVQIYEKRRDNPDHLLMTLGGDSEIMPLGIFGPLPTSFFGEHGAYVPGSFEEDIIGTDFGRTIVLLESDKATRVGSNPAFLAIGAPEADNGKGAAYIFRIGSEGLWIDRKVTQDTYYFGFPIEDKTGLGNRLKFSETHLHIGFYQETGAVSIPINFLWD